MSQSWVNYYNYLCPPVADLVLWADSHWPFPACDTAEPVEWLPATPEMFEGSSGAKARPSAVPFCWPEWSPKENKYVVVSDKLEMCQKGCRCNSLWRVHDRNRQSADPLWMGCRGVGEWRCCWHCWSFCPDCCAPTQLQSAKQCGRE